MNTTLRDELIHQASITPLEEIDVSRPDIYGHDAWGPWFARLRREAPVHRCAQSALGPYLSVTGHAEIMQVDSDNLSFSSEAGGISILDPSPNDELRIETFIAMDEPRHTPKRNAVAPAVSPRALMQLEPLIRERAADILDNLPVGETFNWVDHVSVELTARMLATLLDFPYEERRQLIRWSDIMTNAPGVTAADALVPKEQRLAELMQAASTFMRLWEQRTANPGNDLISMLAHGEATRDMAANPAEFLGNIMLLVVGGNDTTRNSISGGLLALNQFPEQYDRLRGNPGLIPNMVSEMVRWQTPVIHMRRTATRDVELAGQHIRQGDKVVMWYLSGNRDETVFPDADRLVIDRPNARSHVSFGFGVHRCMGNRLAEMQLRVLWEEIGKRFRSVDVVGDVVRVPSNFIRGIATLPVRLQPH